MTKRGIVIRNQINGNIHIPRQGVRIRQKQNVGTIQIPRQGVQIRHIRTLQQEILIPVPKLTMLPCLGKIQICMENTHRKILHIIPRQGKLMQSRENLSLEITATARQVIRDQENLLIIEMTIVLEEEKGKLIRRIFPQVNLQDT